ncbi:hypothetical protein L596_003135 [Steinernema carpocapsae]|uniref:Flavin-containing monooxygenase n=1 Tax=Steinernema carpocapsae TaxID=34508 RepID=A0A4U8URR5_STECR|nr:hypothetical protein L596_003135 [Steinernema carpocapsae]
MTKKVAIVGAGMSGLTAARWALLYDVIPVVFETQAEVGGLWCYKEDPKDGASVMRNTVLNTSKEMTAFSDFVPENKTPVFMRQKDVHRYLLNYTRHFGLDEYINFNTSVLAIERCADFEETGKWTVRYLESESKDEKEDVFDGVLICTGHHSTPWRPLPWRNEKDFRGRIIHSADYRSNVDFRDKTVVVVGLGNSAVDCAVDLSNVAEQVYLSTRRGAWVKPKLGRSGSPTDVLSKSRFNHYKSLLIPTLLKNFLLENELSERMDHKAYGLLPDHHVLSAHPTISEELPGKLASGQIIVKPHLEGFEGKRVEFEDRSVVDNVDAVILCTGYSFDFQILEDRKLVSVFPENDAHLYKYMFPTKLSDHNTLAMIGYVQPLGSLFPVAEMQSRVYYSVLTGKCQLPDKSKMIAELEWNRCQLSMNFVKSRRHTMEVNYVGYMDELAGLIGVAPNMWNLFQTDIKLAFCVLFGPCTAYQYRLSGPHQWEGAKDAILNTKKRLFFPHDAQRNCLFLNNHMALISFVITVILLYSLFL